MRQVVKDRLREEKSAPAVAVITEAAVQNSHFFEESPELALALRVIFKDTKRLTRAQAFVR